ncbi:MAG: hypothetical protein EXQ59_00280 [Acidobacteria bacterium]|nr:hypothetical protein [Acidobacteriota bacterium]
MMTPGRLVAPVGTPNGLPAVGGVAAWGCASSGSGGCCGGPNGPGRPGPPGRGNGATGRGSSS